MPGPSIANVHHPKLQGVDHSPDHRGAGIGIKWTVQEVPHERVQLISTFVGITSWDEKKRYLETKLLVGGIGLRELGMQLQVAAARMMSAPLGPKEKLDLREILDFEASLLEKCERVGIDAVFGDYRVAAAWERTLTGSDESILRSPNDGSGAEREVRAMMLDEGLLGHRMALAFQSLGGLPFAASKEMFEMLGGDVALSARVKWVGSKLAGPAEIFDLRASFPGNGAEHYVELLQLARPFDSEHVMPATSQGLPSVRITTRWDERMGARCFEALVAVKGTAVHLIAFDAPNAPRPFLTVERVHALVEAAVGRVLSPSTPYDMRRLGFMLT